MEHIKRMETELAELRERIFKASDFLRKETNKPKYTDEKQRMRLAIQIEHMTNYAKILGMRIDYDNSNTN